MYFTKHLSAAGGKLAWKWKAVKIYFAYFSVVPLSCFGRNDGNSRSDGLRNAGGDTERISDLIFC